MIVSVDIKHIKNHISLLQEEHRQAKALEDVLTFWYDQASVDGLTDLGFIDRHLRIVRDQKTYIQNRISWLESVADSFTELKYKTADLLADAKDAAKISGYGM